MKYKLSFYKDFKLVPPFCGLVSKVTKPRGKKTLDDDGFIKYSLYSDDPRIYRKAPMMLEPGLYWVLDICKVKDNMWWNDYLFIIEENGNAYPVGEWLNQNDSSWVIQALPVVKKFFNKEKLEAINLTTIDYKKPKKTKWNLRYKRKA